MLEAWRKCLRQKVMRGTRYKRQKSLCLGRVLEPIFKVSFEPSQLFIETFEPNFKHISGFFWKGWRIKWGDTEEKKLILEKRMELTWVWNWAYFDLQVIADSKYKWNKYPLIIYRKTSLLVANEQRWLHWWLCDNHRKNIEISLFSANSFFFYTIYFHSKLCYFFLIFLRFVTGLS